ncbi:MAG: glycosyltransferase family 39 protein [Elusimicrobiota bacterium]
MTILSSVIKKNNSSNILFLCFLTTILLFPFLNKAISIDSIFYIYTAKQILKEPIKPFNFQINCEEKNRFAWDVANNPPLVSYFLAGIIKIFGENEKLFHLIFLSFALLSVIGMYLLSDELKIDPFFSTLLLIASPAFFVNATDIMLDVPMLAFSLLGIYFVIKEKLFGWILLGLAILIKFVAIINLPIVSIWFLLDKKLKKNLVFFLIPILFLIIWSIHNQLTYGEIQILKRTQSVGLSFGIVKEIPLLTYIGGSFIFPISILWLIFNANKKTTWLFVVFFTAINFLFNLLNYTIFQSFLFGLFISCALLLILIFIQYLKTVNFQKEVIFLFSWFLLYLIFFISVSAIIAVRYLLPILPPVIILIVKISKNLSTRKVFLSLTTASGIILSLFIANSDFVLANSYREAAKFIKNNYSNRNIYFTGHLGFQYYMEKNGFLAVNSYEKVYPKNSIMVIPVFPVAQKVHKDVIKRMKRISEKYVFTKNPFKTMNPGAHAGFHLNMYGLLPYSFSNKLLVKFTIYEICQTDDGMTSESK